MNEEVPDPQSLQHRARGMMKRAYNRWRTLTRDQQMSLLTLLLLLVLMPFLSFVAMSPTRVRSKAAPATPPSTTDPFTNLSAVFSKPGNATFSFTYTGIAPSFTVDVSTLPDMSWDVYPGFAQGSSSPVVETNPGKWDKYSCGRTLYWRVKTPVGEVSPITATVVTCAGPTPTPLPYTFTNLNATLLKPGTASFSFGYQGSARTFAIDVSTMPNMSWDVYLTFAQGSNSPVVETNPGKWDKYSCGRILYWRVRTDRSELSPISSAAVTCAGPTPTPGLTPTPIPNPFTSLSSTMVKPGNAAFNFVYSGTSRNFIVDVSTVADMSWDVYMTFAQGSNSPVVETNPGKWDKYSCGRILYWRVRTPEGQYSGIKTTQVVCITATGYTTPTPTPRPPTPTPWYATPTPWYTTPTPYPSISYTGYPTPTPTPRPVAVTPTPMPLAQIQPPVITTSRLAWGFVGGSYSQPVSAQIYGNVPYAMSFSGLPAGLSKGPCARSLNSTGPSSLSCTIFGTPTTSGLFNVTVSVDVNGQSLVRRPMNILILQRLPWLDRFFGRFR